MKIPLLVINFKAYRESMGKRSITISKIAEKLSIETGITVAVAPSAIDILKVKESVSIPVFAQHVDPVYPGAFTGSITMENIKEWGIDGVIINHSERQLKLSEIDFLVKYSRSSGIKNLVCTNNIEVTRAVAELSPDFIAIEPPELIGGEISVSKAKPEVVQDSVREVEKINRSVNVLCGAGIKDREDVKKSMELGAKGVLVASGVVKAKEVEKAILDLLKGMGE